MAVPPTNPPTGPPNQPPPPSTSFSFGATPPATAPQANHPASTSSRPNFGGPAATATTSATRPPAWNLFPPAPPTNTVPAANPFGGFGLFGAPPSAPTNHVAVPGTLPVAAAPPVAAPVANLFASMFAPPPPFEPFLITDPAVQDLLSSESFAQTITAGPPHQNGSLEELRLADYEAGRGKLFFFPSPFHVPTKGMVHLHLPNEQVQRRLQVQFLHNIATCDDFGENVVVFEVGGSTDAKPQRFMIHENVVRPVSEFVRLALDGEWKEATERKIPLPEDEPSVFRVYQSWLYTRRIMGVPCGLLLQCYILGEKFLDTSFKDAVIDCILEVIARRRVFQNYMSGLVYKNTPEGSPLRRLMCELFAWCATATWYDEVPDGEMLVDLAKMQTSFWNGQKPKTVPFLSSDVCAYHSHGKEACYREGTFPVV
ncbi:hypothetical protein LTS10_011690 [Elasticomyces elasticus]|nr:hypothetical protein LTS10_011690 [Elasticomyces elasticus]